MSGGTLAVPATRRTERIAVNAVRALFDRHGHVVEEVSGGSDFGEDLIVSFVENGQRTAQHIAIQVKGGTSFRQSVGYGVPVRQHGRDWRDSNIPVICVVYDPDLRALFWANATEQLNKASKTLRTITIDEVSILNDHTVDEFVQSSREYVAGRKLRPHSPMKRETPRGPDLLFAPAARWVENHNDTLRAIVIVLAAMAIAALLILMGGSLWQFGEKYLTLPPWLWVVTVLGYTMLGLGIIIYEARQGRRSFWLGLAVYSPLFLAYYASFGDALGVASDSFSRVVAAVVPQIVKYAMILGVAFFIGRELDRRRRMRAMGAHPDLASHLEETDDND